MQTDLPPTPSECGNGVVTTRPLTLAARRNAQCRKNSANAVNPTDCAATAPDASNPRSSVDLRITFLHDALATLLADPAITVACGNWADGAISEILPKGNIRLLPGIYTGSFAGIRELRLVDAPHHLHIDLARVHSLCYIVAPSVCHGFNPSLEVRLLLTDARGAPTDRSIVSLMIANPYGGDGRLDPLVARKFFQSAMQLMELRPDLVKVQIEPDIRSGVHGPTLLQGITAAMGSSGAVEGWSQALTALGISESTLTSRPSIEPPIIPLLREALNLPDASLVIYRDRTLVEFKTERLGGLHRYVEQGHASWQIGDLDDHHCHLSLDDVSTVEFSAEPVSCQGNRLNYTVWFLVTGACGNPYRTDGYFSITLNRPYAAGVARLDVINPLFALYEQYAEEAWVRADEQFLRALREGPPSKRFGGRDHASTEQG